jgi:hypothetical protein
MLQEENLGNPWTKSLVSTGASMWELMHEE